MRMKALVTGAGGMLGSHLVEELYAQGYEVTGLWHKNKKNIEQITAPIEFIQCDGKYWFIEVNLRCDATTYAVAVAGVNLPVAYVNATLTDGQIRIENSSIRSIDSMVEFRDVEFVLKGQLNLFKWLRQRAKCECKYYYNCFDRRPYREYIHVFRKRLMTRFWNRMSRK